MNQDAAPVNKRLLRSAARLVPRLILSTNESAMFKPILMRLRIDEKNYHLFAKFCHPLTSAHYVEAVHAPTPHHLRIKRTTFDSFPFKDLGDLSCIVRFRLQAFRLGAARPFAATRCVSL